MEQSIEPNSKIPAYFNRTDPMLSTEDFGATDSSASLFPHTDPFTRKTTSHSLIEQSVEANLEQSIEPNYKIPAYFNITDSMLSTEDFGATDAAASLFPHTDHFTRITSSRGLNEQSVDEMWSNPLNQTARYLPMSTELT